LGAAAKKVLTTDIDKQAVEKVYGRWAPVYDLAFGAIFERWRRAAIAASERIGGRILEVGVGSGISLPYYSDKSRIVGIDLSEQMLWSRGVTRWSLGKP
jgi:phosphatidylethanolamine/phosphatidyl-N-methylethanolamine N-methyltransferase